MCFVAGNFIIDNILIAQEKFDEVLIYVMSCFLLLFALKSKSTSVIITFLLIRTKKESFLKNVVYLCF